MLPEAQIHAILQKFGPQITKYLQSIGYFSLEGPYQPTDIMDQVAMRKFLAASKAKNAEVWGVLEKWLLPEMVGNGEKFIATYGLKKQAIPVAEIATEYIDQRGGELIKRMVQTDKRKLTNYIWQNSSMNERPLARQILKEPNLAGIVDNSGFRTRTIIRTERARATRGGAQAFAGNAGATTKTWHHVGDGRVRPSHRALGGTKIKIDEDFDGEGPYPGSSSINCRCYLEYGFDKDVATTPSPSMRALEDLYGEVTPSQKASVARKVAPVAKEPRKVASLAEIMDARIREIEQQEKVASDNVVKAKESQRKTERQPQKTKSGKWSEFGSLSDAEKQFKGSVSIEDGVDNKTAMEALNAIGKEHNNLLKKFKQLENVSIKDLRLGKEELEEIRAMGSWQDDGQVMRIHFQSASEAARRNQLRSDKLKSVKGSTIADAENIFRHEYGHAAYQQLLTEDEHFAIRSAFLDLNESVLEKTVSRYATTDPDEAFAEMFNLMAKGKKLPEGFYPEAQNAIKRILA